MTSDEKIADLEKFRGLLNTWESLGAPSHRRRPDPEKVRSQINQAKTNVRRIIVEQGCLKLLTIAPPRMTGGMLIRNADPFDLIFDPPYTSNMIPTILDMLDEAIGSIRVESDVARSTPDPSLAVNIKAEVVSNFAFVAMPMDPAIIA